VRRHNSQTPENVDRSDPVSVRGIAGATGLTGLSDRTISELISTDSLPHRRCGRALLFLPDELRAWMDQGCPTDPGAADRVRAAMRKGARHEA
jgi:predicted DNA-binding transcriptional regulator AlpA